MGRDVERAESEEDLEKKRKEEEEELKAAKKRQATLDNIGVLVAVIIMVLLALVIVSFKILTSDPGPERHFEPLHQKVDSTIMYTGHGYIPCEGFVPTPAWCKFPPYKARLQRPYNPMKNQNSMESVGDDERVWFPDPEW